MAVNMHEVRNCVRYKLVCGRSMRPPEHSRAIDVCLALLTYTEIQFICRVNSEVAEGSGHVNL